MSANRKPLVLITHCEIPEIALTMLKESCELITCPELPYPSRERLLAKVEGVDAIFWQSKEQLDRDMIDKAGPNLRVVGTMSAGYDNIAVHELKARGIKVGNTPHVLAPAVAEMAIGLLLEVARRIPEGRKCIENGCWEVVRPQWMLGKDLVGSTVGIVGLGGIGQAIARRIKAFDISRLLYYGRNVKPEAAALGAEFVRFEDLLAQSDFVIVACPLTDATKNLFNDETFALMKSSAILINIARGGIVDQGALLRALQQRKIWGAGLDVMTPEPLPKDSPLLQLPNCVLAPHLGSATENTRHTMAQLTARNILAGLRGEQMPCPL